MKTAVKLTAGLVLVFLSLVLAGCGKEKQAMVSTANPHASRAALKVLADGGTALDAAIAAQMVLTLVEPQSSGIGGGLFLLHWDAANGQIAAWDGRETAPAAAGPEYFLTDSGAPMEWSDASIGGRPVGVPGVIDALWQAHKVHGKLDWKQLFQPAIELAEGGFAVSPRLHEAIAGSPELLANAEAAALYFTGQGEARAPVAAGTNLRNPLLAETLKAIAKGGPDAFYRGVLAEKIIAAVHGHEANPSVMNLADLAAFKATRRAAVCDVYRQYRVCGMPPPTSGGLTTLMILGMLERFDMGTLKPNSAAAVHLFTQASRLAYADRGAYMGDADFVEVPVAGLIDKGYLKQRSQLIDPARDMGKTEAGVPPGAEDLRKADVPGLKEFGTTHLVIVDAAGNAVSMTSSVERGFGSHISVGGFILNSQLTDFEFVPESAGVPVPNRVEGGKRPRSSMSPTLVFDSEGNLFAAVGSPGGSRIITYVTQTLIALLDWNMDMQAAIALPRVLNRNGETELEADKGLEALSTELKALGHQTVIRRLESGLHGIRIQSGRLDGGADPRREGVVLELAGN